MRYQRRRIQREIKRRKGARLSRKGVGKKASVQKYFINELYNETVSRNKILHGKDIREGFIEFDLRERGHDRHIRAMHFRERVIQRVICDFALIPVLTRSLVYDNGASLKGCVICSGDTSAYMETLMASFGWRISASISTIYRTVKYGKCLTGILTTML